MYLDDFDRKIQRKKESFRGVPGRSGKGYLEWERTEMDLRAVPALYWPVSGRRSVWEIYGDFRIWYRIGVE